jgi:TonB family protein
MPCARTGVVAYQLVLDPEGLPTECRVIESSGHADLDALTCDILMKRARFSPARDENNNALGSWYRGRMRWVVPDEVEPAAPATGPNHSAPPPSKEK